ncbi:MAG: translation initiation factor IF-3, partial [Mycoplasmataceae bacterium]|nr:translation initiation factor IF-3 [Mycoplasmataceae bacterium]
MSGFTKKINNDIKESKLIVIDSTGKNLGQVTRSVAIAKAKEQNLDLVLISSSDNEKNKLPVAKIIDYKKFLYNQKIKEKQARKNQEIITVKEIKIRPQIGNHDLM